MSSDEFDVDPEMLRKQLWGDGEDTSAPEVKPNGAAKPNQRYLKFTAQLIWASRSIE